MISSCNYRLLLFLFFWCDYAVASDYMESSRYKYYYGDPNYFLDGHGVSQEISTSKSLMTGAYKTAIINFINENRLLFDVAEQDIKKCFLNIETQRDRLSDSIIADYNNLVRQESMKFRNGDILYIDLQFLIESDEISFNMIVRHLLYSENKLINKSQYIASILGNIIISKINEMVDDLRGVNSYMEFDCE